MGMYACPCLSFSPAFAHATTLLRVGDIRRPRRDKIMVPHAGINDLAGDGAGHFATAAAVFDEDAEGDLGSLGGGKADEPGVGQVLMALAHALVPLILV